MPTLCFVFINLLTTLTSYTDFVFCIHQSVDNSNIIYRLRDGFRFDVSLRSGSKDLDVIEVFVLLLININNVYFQMDEYNTLKNWPMFLSRFFTHG